MSCTISLNLIGEPIVCDISFQLFVDLFFSYGLEATIDFGDNKSARFSLTETYTPSTLQFQYKWSNPGKYIVSFSIESYSFIIKFATFEVFRKFSFCLAIF